MQYYFPKHVSGKAVIFFNKSIFCIKQRFFVKLFGIPMITKRSFFLFFSVYILCQQISFSAEIVRHQTITWKGTQSYQLSESQKISYLYFTGANYNFSTSYLPFLNEDISLPASTSGIQVKIFNVVYLNLNEDEIKTLGAQKISNEIDVNYFMSYEKKLPFASFSFTPIRKNDKTGKIEKVVSYSVQVSTTEKASQKVANANAYVANSVLKTGTWYKIGVTKDGLYKINYAYLKSLGIDMTILDPKKIRVYGNGGGLLSFKNSDFHYDDLQENAIAVEGESDGRFDTTDFVWFFGRGPHKWVKDNNCATFRHILHLYSDTNYYFINIDLGLGKRMATQGSNPNNPNKTVTSFDDFQFYESESQNLVKSGRVWYGETFDVLTSYNFPFTFPNIDASIPASIRGDVAARSAPSSTFNFTCQGASLSLQPSAISPGCYFCDWAAPAGGCTTFTPSSSTFDVNVNFVKNPSYTSAIGYLNYIEVNARRFLKLSGNEMLIRDTKSEGAGNVSDFIVSDVTPASRILEVSDPLNVRIQSAILSGNTLSFRQATDTLREFFVYNDKTNAFKVPAKFGAVANQDLHATGFKDFLIVAHPMFLSEAKRLATLHETKDGLSTLIVTPQQIYNEFSSGVQDITAIKHFVKMFYDRANNNAVDMPKYLLLFGDASYNNRVRSVASNTNFIPSYESFNSYSYTQSYVTDDYFGLLDSAESDGLGEKVDIGIGRFPVKNNDEAKAVVDKIVDYTTKKPLQVTQSYACNTGGASSSGDWKNWVCFVADDQDVGAHMNESDQLANYVDVNYNKYNIDKIFLDAYKQEASPGGQRYPDAKNALNQRVEKGALILNYTGHGGELGWCHERVLEIADINNWKNDDRLPLFVTATCEFSRFDDPARTSAGELVFLHPKGGGIGLLTTTRLTFGSENFTLNYNFYRNVFKPINGEMPRLGDVCRTTKNLSANNATPNHRNFTFLGDPALTLHYTEDSVVTVSINNKPLTTDTSLQDTINALSKVTITGYVCDAGGSKRSSFNGLIYPTIFDKFDTITTLANDGLPDPSPHFKFKSQKNIVYRGKVSVTNGDFSFTFIVPKDISYRIGKGRISYYANDGTVDIGGYNENFKIGGINANAPIDNAGPELSLFMNDPKFVSGSITNEHPNLLGILKDENGINTVGNGIGHDIVAVMDENTEKSIVLNDYYQSDLNSYQSGIVLYGFNNLTEGRHTLTLKAWDVYNNSTKSGIEFVVAKSAKLAIEHVLNYPNPFTTHTEFMFEHNQPCSGLEAQIQIFTVSGKLIKTIREAVRCDGFRADGMDWDGKDDFGDSIGRGVYVYKLKVTAADGTYAEKYEKLVILN